MFFADDTDGDGAIGRGTDGVAEVAGIVDSLIINTDDDVAGTEAGLFGATIFFDRASERTSPWRESDPR